LDLLLEEECAEEGFDECFVFVGQLLDLLKLLE